MNNTNLLNSTGVLTNDLKKGTAVRLRSGWKAIIADNMRGNIRMAEVFGIYRETGSVYVWDIASLEDGTPIQLTPSQLKARKAVLGR